LVVESFQEEQSCDPDLFAGFDLEFSSTGLNPEPALITDRQFLLTKIRFFEKLLIFK
jgi:hypothetical protein